MARKKKTTEPIDRETILNTWHDVFGVNQLYEFRDTGTSEGQNHITMGMNVYSLNLEDSTDIILSFTEDDMCKFVETFLMEYHDIYLNYLVSTLKISDK